jgi:hypothetical protein
MESSKPRVWGGVKARNRKYASIIKRILGTWIVPETSTGNRLIE